ncbi:MAG: hypothetical protein ACO2OQ_03600 [Thermofilaceae archaeon]|jgi:endogenous inhibitor of DNA gyrase (YacG/DUF329 family)|nr:hypothetical protein [Thermofilum sp.]
MFTVTCSRCKYVFYKGEKIPNLYKIYVRFGGRCPVCGREIGWVPQSIDVKAKR